MGFNWQQDAKERYYQRTEETIEAAGFGDFLHVERTAFGITGSELVRVYLEPIHRQGNMRRWWAAKRAIGNLKEPKPPKDSYGRKQETLMIRGFIEFEMEEQDR